MKEKTFLSERENVIKIQREEIPNNKKITNKIRQI